jgi:two-component system sensor histidine kinase AlgZ
MHPILAHRGRLTLYLIAWLVLGLLMTLLTVSSGNLEWPLALFFSLPLSFFFAFVNLSAYYLCRAFPLERGQRVQLFVVFGFVSLLSSALWTALGSGWYWFLDQITNAGAPAQWPAALTGIFFGVGAVLYLLSVSVTYLMIEFERSAAAERREFELKMLAQEAELKTLRSQIDPHFLFNSLNSISALTTNDPAGARGMTLLLAEFLRKSLNLGAKDKITLAEELELSLNFLEIEKIRLGERLQVLWERDPSADNGFVPPLLLQPLIENAIKHGIAGLVGGGLISIQTKRAGSLLRIFIENPIDQEAPKKNGENLGLGNVTKRLAALYAGKARIDIIASGTRYRIEILLPAEEEES